MRRVLTRLVAATVLFIAIGATPAFAHEHRPVAGGKYQFLVGWADEPTGFKNGVSVTITDASDKPVTDITDTLKAQVKTGEKTGDYTLEPAFEVGEFGTPGEYRADLIPTKAGVYSFHFTGTIHGDAIDETFTSSDTTFDGATDASEAEFPDKAPSAGQLSERIARESARAQAARTAADKAKDDASSAKTVGLAGIVVGALGLVVGAVALTRKR
jgi:hypothetical protein